MKVVSLDPRVARLEFREEHWHHQRPLRKGEQWPTYEVFQMKKRGTQAVHVGIVHAPSPEIALAFAKEQYTRRGTTVRLWVVPSDQIYSTAPEDEVIFATTPEKIHREPFAYKVKEKIERYKKIRKA